jgi:23S rRNA (pseudouridine1915-N3)-methyltransferase
MQIIIVAVGHKMPRWVDNGFSEYTKRMPKDFRIVLKTIRPVKRLSMMSVEKSMIKERHRIKMALPKSVDYTVVLDEYGKDLTSVHLSNSLTEWHQNSYDICFIIGGADGLDPELKANADAIFRLSSMTLPHGMVRVLLAEQLYRAWSIMGNHPYHRE